MDAEVEEEEEEDADADSAGASTLTLTVSYLCLSGDRAWVGEAMGADSSSSPLPLLPTPMGMPSQVSMLTVEPPQTTTVTITIRRVVVRIICLASLRVFLCKAKEVQQKTLQPFNFPYLMAKAKAMAPRKPEKNIMCWMFMPILVLRPRFKTKESGYTLRARPTMIARNAPLMKAASNLMGGEGKN